MQPAAAPGLVVQEVAIVDLGNEVTEAHAAAHAVEAGAGLVF